MVMYFIVYSCHVCVCYEISKDKLKFGSIVYCLYSPLDGATEVSKRWRMLGERLVSEDGFQRSVQVEISLRYRFNQHFYGCFKIDHIVQQEQYTLFILATVCMGVDRSGRRVPHLSA